MKKKTVSFILAVSISITGTTTSNAATKPKCTGKTLVSFKIPTNVDEELQGPATPEQIVNIVVRG